VYQKARGCRRTFFCTSGFCRKGIGLPPDARRQVLVFGAAALLLMAFGASRASAANVHCGQVITTNTVVENDVRDCPGDGLVIGADNITLDLNGHLIAVGGGVGVKLVGVNGATVKNGAIVGFKQGVSLGSDPSVDVLPCVPVPFCPALITTQNNHLSDLTVAHNGYGVSLGFADNNTLRGITARNNPNGIFLRQSNGNLLVQNRVSDNGNGITIFPFAGRDTTGGNSLVRNTASHNQGYGIALGNADGSRLVENVANRNLFGILVASASFSTGGNLVENNKANGNDNDGITIEGNNNLLAGNRALANGANGFHLFPGGGNRLLLNLALENERDGFLVERFTGAALERNRAIENGDDGIKVDTAGTTVTQNRADRNVDFGIEAVLGVIDGGGNLAHGNGNPLQCLNVVCFSFRTVQRAGQTAIRLPVTAGSEDVWTSASGSVAARGASKAYRLRQVKSRFVGRGSRATLKLMISAKVRKAIKRALRKQRAVTARIKLSVRDGAGTIRSIRRTVRLKR
jgi:parallel beta-helix repeat protein